MDILINFYNQKGAGPKNIATNFINELLNKGNSTSIILIPDNNDFSGFISTDHVRFMKLPCFKNVFLKCLFRIYLELFLIPIIVKKHKVHSFLAFGNFLFSPVKVIKTVLLHHPYLVDDQLFDALPFKIRLIEKLKRFAFYCTTKNIDHLVVQSEYMEQCFIEKFPQKKSIIKIIPNPISKTIESAFYDIDINQVCSSRNFNSENELRVVYVSRFYPHKNHSFLLALSRELHQLKIKHKIYVTVDSNIEEAQYFLTEITKSDSSIINLGELAQADLVDLYKKSHVLCFPSKSETFGNPLIEAMGFGLPIIVPDLGYARAVVAEAGNYYFPDNAVACSKILQRFYENKDFYNNRQKASLKQFKYFPNVAGWLYQYIQLMQEEK